MAIGNLATGTFAIPTSTTNSLSGITGAAATYTATQFSFAIDGKVYLKATASGASTPTTDSATGAALTLSNGYGCVCVWTVDSGGTVAIYKSSEVALDASRNFVGGYPNFPAIPATVAPFAYTVHKNYSGSGFTFGTTNWNTSNTAHATQNVIYLPERPQGS